MVGGLQILWPEGCEKWTRQARQRHARGQAEVYVWAALPVHLQKGWPFEKASANWYLCEGAVWKSLQSLWGSGYWVNEDPHWKEQVSWKAPLHRVQHILRQQGRVEETHWECSWYNNPVHSHCCVVGPHFFIFRRVIQSRFRLSHLYFVPKLLSHDMKPRSKSILKHLCMLHLKFADSYS